VTERQRETEYVIGKDEIRTKLFPPKILFEKTRHNYFGILKIFVDFQYIQTQTD
jgi:hypothetical protein